jgi:hypothetical protein
MINSKRGCGWVTEGLSAQIHPIGLIMQWPASSFTAETVIIHRDLPFSKARVGTDRNTTKIISTS